MRQRLAQFMMGRYGNDPLNQVLMIAALVLMFASIFWMPLYVVALALMVWALFRMFSRNVGKRQVEYAAFSRLRGRVANFFKSARNRLFGTKTHRYYSCPGCKQQVRVPRGKGQIDIHCPKCGASFRKRT